MKGGLWRSTSRASLFAAVGLAMGGVAMPSAKAADLGGDCCADLEERVAELEATTARKGNRKASLTISGQVSTGLMVWEQGPDSDVYVVDNAVSRSSFTIDGSAKISSNLTSGYQLVVAIATGSRSNQVTQVDDDGGTPGDSVLALELANWYLDHKALGRVTVGRISTASAGTTGVDLGGASVIANANLQLWAGSFFMTQNGVLSGDTTRWSTFFGGTAVGINTLARANGISYTSPVVGGFSVQAAWGEDDLWDAAVRYAGQLGDFRVALAASYGKNLAGTGDAEDATAGNLPLYGAGTDVRKWQGSASVIHVPSGIYLNGAIVNQEYRQGPGTVDLVFGGQRPDTRLYYLQGGIAKNWTGLGNTVLYGEWARVDDGASGLITAAWRLPVQHAREHVGRRHCPAYRCSGNGALPGLSRIRGIRRTVLRVLHGTRAGTSIPSRSLPAEHGFASEPRLTRTRLL